MVFSDGCGSQYKSRKNVQAMVKVGIEFQIVIDWIFAPTASFKTPLDGAGNNAKVYLRKGEVRQVHGMRATTARAAFEALKAHMPQPAPVAANWKPVHINIKKTCVCC